MSSQSQWDIKKYREKQLYYRPGHPDAQLAKLSRKEILDYLNHKLEEYKKVPNIYTGLAFRDIIATLNNKEEPYVKRSIQQEINYVESYLARGLTKRRKPC